MMYIFLGFKRFEFTYWGVGFMAKLIKKGEI